jgi:hypothetical protein
MSSCEKETMEMVMLEFRRQWALQVARYESRQASVMRPRSNPTPITVRMAHLSPAVPRLQSPEKIGQDAPNRESDLLRYAAFCYVILL